MRVTCRAAGREEARSGALGILLPTKALLVEGARNAVPWHWRHAIAVCEPLCGLAERVKAQAKRAEM